MKRDLMIFDCTPLPDGSASLPGRHHACPAVQQGGGLRARDEGIASRNCPFHVADGTLGLLGANKPACMVLMTWWI
ncbi:MAG: hypothetical protein Q6373_006595 [Candidatus Sigynarchaeota archaeon]